MVMDPALVTPTSQAGTGFMMSLTEGILKFQKKGYKENLSPRFDHFECRSGAVKLYPKDFTTDAIVRFENTSDPDDQSILYAISSPDGTKGLYVDSFGLYHDELSSEMIQKLKDHPH